MNAFLKRFGAKRSGAAVLPLLVVSACVEGGSSGSPLSTQRLQVLASDSVYVTSNSGNAVERWGGGLLISNSESPGFIQVLDSLGKRKAWVGRRGEGPEEFGFVRDMAVAPDGTVWVLDSGNRRLTQLDSDLSFLATYPAPFRPQPAQGFGLESLSNGDLLLLGCWESVENCGAHRWSPKGLVWSYRLESEEPGNVMLAAATSPDGTSIWLVEQFSYVVHELESSGVLVRRQRLNRPWFDDWSQSEPAPGSPSAQETERTGVVGISSPQARIFDLSVSGNRVVILGRTGDTGWMDAREVGYLDLGRYTDSVLEVLALPELTAVATAIFDVPKGMVREFLTADELLVSETHELADGLSVWAFQPNNLLSSSDVERP